MVAGPGAGKTRVLTHAIAHRIGAGLPPERCLAVTFTRRARDELRDRLAALLGADIAGRVTVATFHGLGLLILREQCKLLGLGADLKVADEKTRREVLRSAVERAAVRPRGYGDRRCGSAAWSTCRRAGDAPGELLGADPALAAAYRERWTDVFVDEYQDVDEQQYLMLRRTRRARLAICAIGDPDQAIYGFRGGDVGYFLRFAEDFGDRARRRRPGAATTVRLSRSYRSAPTIVRAAHAADPPGHAGARAAS